jgi:hypothetical protein
MPALTPPLTIPPTPTPVKKDTRHPKIKLLMDPYLKRYNNFVYLLDILTVSGKRLTSNDAFADGVTNVISKGVLYYTNLPAKEDGGGSPPNKCKGRGGAPAGS